MGPSMSPGGQDCDERSLCAWVQNLTASLASANMIEKESIDAINRGGDMVKSNHETRPKPR